MPKENIQQIEKPVEVKKQKKVMSLLDDDEENSGNIAKPAFEEKKVVSNDDPFGILGLDVGGNPQNNVPPPPQGNNDLGGLDLLGGFGGSQNTSSLNAPKQNTNSGDLLGDDFLGGGQKNVQPPPMQANFLNTGYAGENLLNPA
jgi:hypothetical protein